MLPNSLVLLPKNQRGPTLVAHKQKVWRQRPVERNKNTLFKVYTASNNGRFLLQSLFPLKPLKENHPATLRKLVQGCTRNLSYNQSAPLFIFRSPYVQASRHPTHSVLSFSYSSCRSGGLSPVLQWIQGPVWARSGGVAAMAGADVLGTPAERTRGWQANSCCRSFWALRLLCWSCYWWWGGHWGARGKRQVGGYWGSFPQFPMQWRGTRLVLEPRWRWQLGSSHHSFPRRGGARVLPPSHASLAHQSDPPPLPSTWSLQCSRQTPEFSGKDLGALLDYPVPKAQVPRTPVPGGQERGENPREWNFYALFF